MKRSILLFLVFATNLSFAQTYDVNLSAKLLGGYKGLKKGQDVVVSKLSHEFIGDINGNMYNEYYVIVNNRRYEVKKDFGKKFKFVVNSPQDLWNVEILTNVLFELADKGLQSDIRSDMAKDALKYIQKVKASDLGFKDALLEKYICNLIAKIAPSGFIDGRPGRVKLFILDDPSLNAAIYPNGTFVINTGLLAIMHSEADLAAILSHKIAHFILDHSVSNYVKGSQRSKDKFWSELESELSAENTTAYQNSYYVPGAATLEKACLSSTVASKMIEHLGMNYSHSQENEADRLALLALALMGYDKNALATAFSRLEQAMVKKHAPVMYFASYSHPDLNKRIYKCGYPQIVRSKDFEKKISSAVTSTARMKYEDKNFEECVSLVEQNIRNGVAVPLDYILKANCLLALNDNKASNENALQMLEVAERLDPDNINIYKSKMLVYYRLKDKNLAEAQLDEYKKGLDRMKSTLSNMEDDRIWSDLLKFISIETEWVKNMMIKLKEI